MNKKLEKLYTDVTELLSESFEYFRNLTETEESDGYKNVYLLSNSGNVKAIHDIIYKESYRCRWKICNSYIR